MRCGAIMPYLLLAVLHASSGRRGDVTDKERVAIFR
jgi:hypothetical protein